MESKLPSGKASLKIIEIWKKEDDFPSQWALLIAIMKFLDSKD